MRFQAGDIVKIISGTGWLDNCVGQIGVFTTTVYDEDTRDSMGTIKIGDVSCAYFSKSDVVELVTDSVETKISRKDMPVFSGVFKYFPNALLEVSKVSKKGNDQHNPGEPLHWAKDKSTDHLDALSRHTIDEAKDPHGFDTDGIRHSAKIAWRALANLEEELEAANNEK